MRALLLVAGAVATANADVVSVQTVLNGAQEVPQNDVTMNTEAEGIADLTVDTDTGLFSLTLTVTGLTLDELQNAGPNPSPIHIHSADGPGTTGGIAIDVGFLGDFAATADGFTLTVTDAEFGGVQGGITSDTTQNIADLLAANLYYNVHTIASPSGEIRGDIVPTPGALAALGLGGLLATRRRR